MSRSIFTLLILTLLPLTTLALFRTTLPQSTIYNSLKSSIPPESVISHVCLNDTRDRITYASFREFYTTEAQHYLFANQHIGLCPTTPASTSRNDILIFKVLMYPNHYPNWGSYLPLGRLPNVTFLHGNDYYFIAHDSTHTHLYIRTALKSRGKNLADLLHAEALEDFGMYLEHPRDEFREIWKKMLNMGPYRSDMQVYDNGNGMILTHHDTHLTLWNLREFIQHVGVHQNDTTIRRTSFTSQHPIRRVAMRKYPLERNEQVEDIFLLTSQDLHFVEWQAEAQEFVSIPIQMNEEIPFNDIVDIQMNENRDCHDAYIYPNDKFKCPCDESRSRRFIMQGEKSLYYASYVKVLVEETNEASIQLTLHQKIELPLHCIGQEKRVLSRSKDDMLVVIGCANYVNMYLFDGEKYHWMENDHTADGVVQSIAIHNFESYYITIAFESSKWIQYRVPGDLVRKCDPRARITSFFLPPAPVYPLTNDTPNSVQDFDLYNTEIYGLAATRTLTVLGVLCIVVLVGISYGPLTALEQKLAEVPLVHTIYRVISSRYIFYLSCTGMFLFSIFEILMETDFINDWPAHLHHIERFMGGELNYENFMHHHGPCTYAGGFLWLYSVYQFLTQGNLQRFQFLWALMELVHWQVMRSILRAASLPPVLALFAVFSNRLHLYNVRVVINDFPSVFMMHVAILLLLRHRWLLASILYSFVVSTKLNFVFYSPAIFVVLMRHVGLKKTLGYCALMGLLQLVVGVPFIASNSLSYFSTAYDVKRTLLWEKTKNFKFLGRLLYHDWRVSVFLLGVTVTCVCALLLLVYLQGMKLTAPRHRTTNATVLYLLLACNFFFVCFARGFYTPFLCWYLYTLPILMYLSGTPRTLIVVYFSVHELLVRNWGSMEAEMWVSLVLFVTNMMVVLDIFSYATKSARDSIMSRQKEE